jgi:hypothetical protein
MEGNIVRNKVRYCVKGFRQVYGRNFTSTTSPTARLESFRAVLHVAAARNWDVQQVDIKTAILNARLPDDEVPYTRQPKHFEEKGKEGWMWMLLQSLYGLKQSGQIWNWEMDESMAAWGFRRILCEWCIYVCLDPTGDTNIVVVHINDMICVAPTRAANKAFKQSSCGIPRLLSFRALVRRHP